MHEISAMALGMPDSQKPLPQVTACNEHYVLIVDEYGGSIYDKDRQLTTTGRAEALAIMYGLDFIDEDNESVSFWKQEYARLFW